MLCLRVCDNFHIVSMSRLNGSEHVSTAEQDGIMACSVLLFKFSGITKINVPWQRFLKLFD
jgi:hypothetical protein